MNPNKFNLTLVILSLASAWVIPAGLQAEIDNRDMRDIAKDWGVIEESKRSGTGPEDKLAISPLKEKSAKKRKEFNKNIKTKYELQKLQALTPEKRYNKGKPRRNNSEEIRTNRRAADEAISNKATIKRY